MAEIVIMPALSDTMEEGTLVAWLKQVGDFIEPGDLVAEIETDKATQEFEAVQEGHLLYRGVKEGESIPVGAILAILGEEGEDYSSLLESQAAAPAQVKEELHSPVQGVTQAKAASPTTLPAQKAPSTGNGRIKASPLAKRMAQDSGIDLTALSGSGDQGRIIKRDIEAAIENGAPQAASVEAFSFDGADRYQDAPVSQMRKTIARRLGESKYSAPHFYLTINIEMDRAAEVRAQINSIEGVKISYNDLVIKAAAAALKQHPAINSSWLGDTIRTHESVHIGVAVAVAEGLLVPVVRHADKKSLSQVNSEVRALAGKAKERKLSLDEMQGNTFTISNLGMFGIEEFTAIINPPDACIMAVGAMREEPVVKDGQLTIGKRMKVTLSCDHRVVDGVTGAQFLQTFKAIMENPFRLMV